MKCSSHFKVLLKPDYNSITYVQPNGYDLFVVSHTYMPGFTQDFIVHMIYVLLLSTSKTNSIINLPNLIDMNISLHFLLIFQNNLTLTSLKPNFPDNFKNFPKVTKGSAPDVSNVL